MTCINNVTINLIVFTRYFLHTHELLAVSMRHWHLVIQIWCKPLET